ncbi:MULTISPECIES: helix-turn-helix domain-containing protein [unclassified Brevundimonas]|uniref:helix-turn-helix domain-containing protein n=1 Tax=unclassified Brevundimonas TaxID=2622653 RepID=UPI001304C080|nr:MULTISPECIES: helix-turn-helix domain-containing protein [unclassified Brevundimonas]
MPRLKTTDEMDAGIGAGVRARRLALGWSQAELARRVGVTYQQIQKYEAGSNRVSAAVLTKVAAALGCELAALVPWEVSASERSDLQALYAVASALPTEKLSLLLEVALTFQQALSADGRKERVKGRRAATPLDGATG